MSPTSYLTAPPRGELEKVRYRRVVRIATLRRHELPPPHVRVDRRAAARARGAEGPGRDAGAGAALRYERRRAAPSALARHVVDGRPRPGPGAERPRRRTRRPAGR